MELRVLAAKKRDELAVLAQLKAADFIKNGSVIAEQKSSGSISTERKGDEEVMTDYEEDLRDKEKMQENRERLTENTPEVRQEVRKNFRLCISNSLCSLRLSNYLIILNQLNFPSSNT
jgi:hypothetical protein